MKMLTDNEITIDLTVYLLQLLFKLNIIDADEFLAKIQWVCTRKFVAI